MNTLLVLEYSLNKFGADPMKVMVTWSNQGLKSQAVSQYRVDVSLYGASGELKVKERKR